MLGMELGSLGIVVVAVEEELVVEVDAEEGLDTEMVVDDDGEICENVVVGVAGDGFGDGMF